MHYIVWHIASLSLSFHLYTSCCTQLHITIAICATKWHNYDIYTAIASNVSADVLKAIYSLDIQVTAG